MYIYFDEISGNNYTLWSRVRNDAGTYVWIGDGVIMSDAEHYYEVDVVNASSTSASDGVVTAYLDGVQVDQQSNVDLYDAARKPSRVILGATAGIDEGTAGTFYLDELVFRDDNDEIGAKEKEVNLNWQYWAGNEWADLENISGFTDATNHLTQDGAVYWSANPTNWRPYSVNGSTDLYYIRTLYLLTL